MLGWLAKKGQNSRVYMCIKEVKWDLETSNSVRRATILALAQLFRIHVLAKTGFPADVLSYPLDYKREALLELYEALEHVRNGNARTIVQTKENLRRFGVELPEFAIRHANNTGRGLEVWMATLGAGIASDRRDDVAQIWAYLSGSQDHLAQAILGLREVEERTTRATGIPSDGWFSDTDTNDWAAACCFVPSSFVQEQL